MSDPSVPTADAPPKKLFGGLVMLVIVGGWILALAGWMLWHLYGQVKEIRRFTDPVAQVIGPVVPSAEQKAALGTKLGAFAAGIEAKQAAKLELNVAELNHLLAGQEPVNRLQDIAKVEDITDVIRVKVALALNGIPFTGERLYLNGFITVRPEVRKDQGLFLLTRGIEVPGRELTPGFTQTYLEANHLDDLVLGEVRKDAKWQALMAKITAVRCEAGKVIAEYLP